MSRKKVTDIVGVVKFRSPGGSYLRLASAGVPDLGT
jgi:hypothetical protein